MKKIIEWLKHLLFPPKNQEQQSPLATSDNSSLKIEPDKKNIRVDISSKEPSQIASNSNGQIVDSAKDIISEAALREACQEVLKMANKTIEKYQQGIVTNEELQVTLLRVLAQKIHFLIEPEATETFVIQGSSSSIYKAEITKLLGHQISSYSYMEVIDSELTIKK